MSAALPIIGSIAGGLLSSSDGGGGSTTVQKADPWEGVQPALRTLYDAALQNFNTQGPGYYPANTVGPQSPATMQAQSSIYDLATQPNPTLAAANAQTQQTLYGDYFKANPAVQDLYNIAGRDFMQSSPAMWDLYDSTGRDFFQNTPGMGVMQQVAGGAMLNANPYVNRMFGQASRAVGDQFRENVMPGIASMFSGAGRFGSNQMAEGLDMAEENYGRVLDDLATQIYGGNYANERGLQQQALGQLGQFGLASTGQRQQALTNIGQLGLAGQSQQIGALGELGTNFTRERALQQGAAGMAPALNQADYFGPGMLSGAGAQQDAYVQSLINADIARYNFGQNAPNQELAFLSNILQGAPMGATTSMSGAGGNPLLGMLGGYQMGNAFQGMFGGGGGFSTGLEGMSPDTLQLFGY